MVTKDIKDAVIHPVYVHTAVPLTRLAWKEALVMSQLPPGLKKCFDFSFHLPFAAVRSWRRDFANQVSGAGGHIGGWGRGKKKVSIYSSGPSIVLVE